jgi:F0F1-type ATP synthase membrane subunit b/b'
MFSRFIATLLFLTLSLSQAFASEAQPSGLMGFLRGHTWELFMAWFNLLVLLVLLWKFLFEKLLFPAIDEGLTDIETRLSNEETERRTLAEKTEELRSTLFAMDTRREEALAQAKERALKIKAEILEQARIDERKVLDQAEKDSQTYYLDKVNGIKDDFFHKVSMAFREDASSDSSQALVHSYNQKIIEALGGSDAK